MKPSPSLPSVIASVSVSQVALTGPSSSGTLDTSVVRTTSSTRTSPRKVPCLPHWTGRPNPRFSRPVYQPKNQPVYLPFTFNLYVTDHCLKEFLSPPVHSGSSIPVDHTKLSRWKREEFLSLDETTVGIRSELTPKSTSSSLYPTYKRRSPPVTYKCTQLIVERLKMSAMETYTRLSPPQTGEDAFMHIHTRTYVCVYVNTQEGHTKTHSPDQKVNKLFVHNLWMAPNSGPRP